jgi:hypothetical protein
VQFNFPDGYVDGYYGGGLNAPALGDELDGEAEQDINLLSGYEAIEAAQTITVSGTVRSGVTPLVDAEVQFLLLDDDDAVVESFHGTTDANGDYSVDVPGDLQLKIVVSAIAYKDLVDEFEGDSSDVTDLDFDLVPDDPIVWGLNLEQLDEFDDVTPALDVTVHLYSFVDGEWTEVDSDVSDPEFLVSSLGAGDYRFRFEVDGEWLAIGSAWWMNFLQPFTILDEDELFDPAACYYDFNDVASGSVFDGRFALAAVQDADCHEEGYVAPPETITVTGTVRSGAVPLSGAQVNFTILDEAPDFENFDTDTASDGTYSIEIPSGHHYGILVDLTAYKDQYWDGHNYDGFGPPDYDEYEAGFVDVTDFDFDLVPSGLTAWDLGVLQLDGSGGRTDESDITVHLYQNVDGAWTEVDSDVSDPAIFVEGPGEGDYRFRFESDGTWLALGEVYWENNLQPLTGIAGGPQALNPAVCYYDFDDVVENSYFGGYFALAAVQNADCHAEGYVAPPGGSGTPTTTVTPPKKPVTGSDLDTLPTPTATPTAEPTATPSATPEPTETDKPDDSAPPTDIVPVKAPDFAWLFWLFGILLVIVLAGGAFIIFRRR